MREKPKKKIMEVAALALMVMLVLAGAAYDKESGMFLRPGNRMLLGSAKVEAQTLTTPTPEPIQTPTPTPTPAPTPEPTPTPGPLSYLEQCELDYVKMPARRSREEALAELAELSEVVLKFAYVVENESLYSDGILTTVANNPEMADYAFRYPTAERVVTGGFTQEELEQEYPLFLQWDIRWGFYNYGSSVMGESGCGPACLSMAVYYLTRDESVTPDVVADYSMENGYYVKDVGTAWALMNDYPALYDLHSYSIYRNEKEMKARLDEGDILILSMGPGHFTSGGHFIVIYGYDDDGFWVNDPRCICRSRQSWPYKEIYKEIKNVWTIGEGLIEEQPEETPEPVPEPKQENTQESSPEEIPEEADEDED